MATIAQLIGGPLDGDEVDLEEVGGRDHIAAMRFEVIREGEPTGEIVVYEVMPWRTEGWALVFTGYEEKQ